MSSSFKMNSRRNNTLKLALIALSTIVTQTWAQSTCSPIDTSANLTLSGNATDQWAIYKAPIEAALAAGNKGILDYPAPKQIRAWLGVMSTAFSVMAYYRSDSLDFFGRNDPVYRRCVPADAIETASSDAQAKESFAYAYLWGLQKFVPEWSDIVSDYAEAISVDLSSCPDINTVECSPTTPIGLVRWLFLEAEDVFKNDGWNADGSMVKTYNTLEFEDWRAVADQPSTDGLCTSNWKPAHEACNFWTLDYNDKVCWSPQKYQFNEKIYKEKYAYLHVRDSGRSYFFGDESICSLDHDYPCYDSMGLIADEVIRRVRENTDSTRAQIEFFDNVWNWMNFFTMEYIDNAQDLSQWDIINLITSITAAMYESTLVAFKGKLDHGMTRPKSLIRSIRKGTQIAAWLGPNLGVGRIDGSEWVPYLQDPPYAESPTLKGSLCAAFSAGMKYFTGTDNIGFIIDVVREAGSSEIEDNEPSTNQTFIYATWAQFLIDCKNSRLNSGNHFEKSADLAEDLIVPVANKVMETFLNLNKGIPPPNLFDLDDLSVKKDRCESFGDVSFEISFGKNDGNE